MAAAPPMPAPAAASRPAATIEPRSAAEVRDAVRWALSASAPLEIIGAGTRRAIAERGQAANTLSLGGLAGIVGYEPEELILTVRPGTTLAEIEAALGERSQMMAFEPPSLTAVLGAVGDPTFGGTYATNFAGPRRLTAGAVRDHMLGIEAVSGRGEIFRAGGKVVKNVTGYDLARALAGSWGTLAVLTELTLKVLPRPETEATVVLLGLDPVAAVGAMSKALGIPADVSAAAYLPDAVASAAGLGVTAATLLRLEGFGPSVAARQRLLADDALGAHAQTILSADESRRIWSVVREAEIFGTGSDASAARHGPDALLSSSGPARMAPACAIWRCSVAPTAGPAIAAAAPQGSRWFLDWGGGLVWIEVPASNQENGRGDTNADGGAAAIRKAIRANGGGHAMLMRAPPSLRATVPTFQPQHDGVASLTGRLRAAFDPERVLNPGRMGRTN